MEAPKEPLISNSKIVKRTHVPNVLKVALPHIIGATKSRQIV